MPKKQLLAASISLALMAVFLASSVFGAAIEVNVEEAINSETKAISHESENNMLKMDYDVMNSGSSAYGARMRIDIFNGTKQVATIWSSEETLVPGERKTISMYWYEPFENRNFGAHARLYRAYEIVEAGNVAESFGKASANKSIEISRLRTYGGEIRFMIKSPVDAEKIMVYPQKSPKGWIFEQAIINGVQAGESTPVVIHYETGAFTENDIALIAVAEDGKNYGAGTFHMKREEGLQKWLNIFKDWLGI